MKKATILKIISKNIQIWFFKLTFQRSKIVPYKLFIMITHDCNSKCLNCGIWKINKESPAIKEKELSLTHFEKLFREYGKHLIWLNLMGGETTLHKDFSTIIDLARKHCPQLSLITFTTNGLLPQRVLKNALYIKDAGFDLFVTVSLDGDQKLHDSIRGVKNSYQKAQETFQLLSSNNIMCYFGTVISEKNNDFINAEYEKRRNEIKAITIIHEDGCYSQPNKLNDEIIMNSLETIYKHFKIKNLHEIIEKIYIKIGYFFLKEGRQSNLIQCDALSSCFHISPYGGVAPCMYLPELGNIKDENLLDIFKNSKSDQARKKIRAGDCPHCWLNCYAPHSIMQHPIESLKYYMFKKI